MKSILYCAVLTLPAAYGAPRHPSPNSTTTVPPKARVVVVHPKKTKVLVSTSGASAVDKAKSAQEAKSTVPRVVAARAVPSNSWRLSPKFQKSGKEDTTWGFMFNRRF